MNAIDVELLEAVCAALGQIPGVRAVRVKAPKQKVEIPLSRYVAVVIEPTGVEAFTWLDVPVGRYHLLHWRAAVLDRALPGTAAFKALTSVAEACRNALASDLSLGGLAEDGPPSARNGLAPEVGATRIAPVELGDSEPGGPTALLFSGASGYWEEEMVGATTLDDEMLFSSGAHVIEVGSPDHRIKDQMFNGLAGGLAVDLGEGSREIRQTGVLSAASAASLAQLESAVEAFVDGRTYTLTAPDGADYPNCRMERFERLGPVRVGLRWNRLYRITYRQLVR